MKLLNIACGDRYHIDWVNIDFHSTTKEVKKVNILKSLPFNDETFDVVYSSHFIEHLDLEQAEFVMKESNRVLKKNGILRVVVPDLENLCREYLAILEKTKIDKSFNEKYEWIVIEMLDQMTRVKGGGKMLDYFTKLQTRNNHQISKYIFNRIGYKIESKNKKQYKKITFSRIKNKILYTYLKLIRLLIPNQFRNLMNLNIPIGEKHLWMYDKHSMYLLLEHSGFKEIKVKLFDTSEIKDFNNYYLDRELGGNPYKGVSSLYMEARK